VSYLKRSYLNCLVAVLTAILAASGGLAQTIYLDPAEVYITTGVGTEFDLALRVDDQVTDLKLFTYYATFDNSKLDTVSVAEGPLLPSSGGTTVFNKYIVNGTSLQLEGLILGGGIAVDGPGVLATMRIRIDDTGLVSITPTEFRLRNADGNFISGSAAGCTVYANVPPQEFNLLDPTGGEAVTALPGQYVTLDWEASTSPYAGEGVVYNLDYGTSATFEPGQTTSITGLTGTNYQVAANDLNPDTYYWRVRAVGNVHGFIRNSTPASESFAFAYEEIHPTAFNLLDPIGGETATGLPGGDLSLTWQASTTPYPGENVFYDLDYGASPTFEAGQTVSVTGLTAPSYDIPVNSLILGTYYWRVTAEGDIYHFTTASSPASTSFEFEYAWAPPGPFSLVSPDNGEEVAIAGMSEVVFDWQNAAPQFTGDVVDYAFYLGPDPGLPAGAEMTIPSATSQVAVPADLLPRNSTRYWTVKATNSLGQPTWASGEFSVLFAGCCVGRVGDVNGDGNDEPTIGDISMLVDLLFINNNPAVITCWTEADINQSGGTIPGPDDISIGDISVLIDYLFITGPELGLRDCL